MILRHRIVALSLPVLAAIACATGTEIPEEEGRSPLAAKLDDAGPEAATIRPSATSSTPPPSETPDAATASDSAPPAQQDAAAVDSAPPPALPTTPVCDTSDPSYGLYVIAMAVAGTPPPACTAGACGSGQCCYQGQYCLPQ